MSSTVLDLEMIEDLNEMVATDEVFVENLLNIYFDKTQSLIEDVRNFFVADKRDEAVHALSILNSKSRVIGASQMALQAKKAAEVVSSEKDLKTGEFIDQVDQCFDVTRQEAVRLGLISSY